MKTPRYVNKHIFLYPIMMLMFGIFVNNALSIGPWCEPPCDVEHFDGCGEWTCFRCLDCSCNRCTEYGCESKCDHSRCKWCYYGSGCVAPCLGCKDGCALQGLDCCDGQCYNPLYQECCGGEVYTIGNCMECVNDEWVRCDGDPFQGCCHGQCYNLVTQCCENGSVHYKCGGDCCSEPGQWCCGDSIDGLCCEEGQECCVRFDPAIGFYYDCVWPCEDSITDTSSCSEDNEANPKCNNCKQLSPPTCGTYLDYTGIELEDCSGGCPLSDWDVTEPICYEIKECFPMIHENSRCLECDGEKKCFEIYQTEPLPPPGELGCQAGAGECFAQFSCDIIATCFECEPVGEAIPPPNRKRNCECN